MESNSLTERQNEREEKIVARDKASSETVEYLNYLRGNISDPNAAAAIALLHAQINGDHDNYQRPPDNEAFSHWHRDVTLSTPTVSSVSDTSVTISVDIDLHLIDNPLDVYFRLSYETDDSRDAIESNQTSISSDGYVKQTVSELTPDTEYEVYAVADGDIPERRLIHNSNIITFSTEP